MRKGRSVLCHGLAVAVLALAGMPAGATTLIREGLDQLVATNATIVHGEVVGVSSRWNDERTFMLTDVLLAPREVLKGEDPGDEITLTVMGGTVDELTTLIVGGTELVPGEEYVLFLNDEDLPGAKGARTVRDLCQGAFDIVPGVDGELYAVSQANRHPLLTDEDGESEPPGGEEGIPLDTFKQTIRELVQNPSGLRKGVK